jgi:hypothetical protein
LGYALNAAAIFARYSIQTSFGDGGNRERFGTMHGKLEMEQTPVSKEFSAVTWREAYAGEGTQKRRMRQLRMSRLITTFSFVALAGTLAALAMRSVIKVLF